jgi:hypothetical protein
MGMLDWFKSIMHADNKSGAEAPAAVAAAGDEKGAELAGLNFKTAVDAQIGRASCRERVS